jgi:hypothetical protein
LKLSDRPRGDDTLDVVVVEEAELAETLLFTALVVEIVSCGNQHIHNKNRVYSMFRTPKPGRVLNAIPCY